MLKSGGDLKRFTLCPFVAGVRLWSDSLENKEGVNLITKSRQASRIGERVPHWENNSPFRIIRKQLRDAGLGCGDGREPFQLPISRPPPQVYEARVRSENRADANFFPESQADLDPNTNWLSEPTQGVPRVCAIVRSTL